MRKEVSLKYEFSIGNVVQVWTVGTEMVIAATADTMYSHLGVTFMEDEHILDVRENFLNTMIICY
jgi:hypothetical protein